jgi:hypothetical protein
VPAVLKVIGSESGTTPAVTVLVPALCAPALHVLLVYTVYVAVPLGLEVAPLSVAESCTAVPVSTAVVVESVVVMVGVTFVTVTGSDAQVLVAGLLFVSPAYTAVQCQTPDALLVKPGLVAYGAEGSVFVYAGAAAQVESDGEKSLKVTLPVGLEPPESDAVSLSTVPTGPPADGVVAMVGDTLLTVVCVEPAPLPVSPEVCPANCAEPSSSVWTPTAIAFASLVGTLSTSTVKSMMQVELASVPLDGPKVTAEPGVKMMLPLLSGAPAVKAMPAHAVAAWPVPLCTVNTPVSASAVWHVLFRVVPHDGVCVMVDTEILSVAFAAVDWLVIVSVAGKAVWPTVTGDG